MISYSVVGELQRHLNVSVWTDVTVLDESLAVRVVHHDVQVHVVEETACFRQTRLNHTETLQTIT